MWIDTVPEAVLRAWLTNCPAMKLVTTLDGKILWANPAFREWSQYTLAELMRLTWRDISGPDKNLEGDFDETRTLDAYNPSYTVRKQYQPKQSQPEWGHLTVMRHPLNGDIEYLLCTWDPLTNGTATAFAMAMEGLGTIDKRIKEMTAEIRTITTQTEEEKLLLGSARMVQRHPKLAIAILFVGLSVIGLNNIAELLQRFGLVPAPVVIEKVE